MEGLRQHGRLHSVDLLRGFVMVLMALDHTRDFFGNLNEDPASVASASPALFFTRWITHFCAPVFVFLAGTSAWLSASRGKSRGELSRFLLSRGLWLVVLEYTFVTFGWLLTWRFGVRFHQVIAVIGLSMIVLAGLLWLPRWLILAFGIAVVAGHNALDFVSAEDAGAFGTLWSFLHIGRTFVSVADVPVFVIYPLLPWVGVLALGYVAGPLFQRPLAERRRVLALIGGALIVLFVGLRLTNGYGDPQSFAQQLESLDAAGLGDRSGALMRFAAFVNVEKYPPSLLYLAMTLGPAFLLLAALDREPGPLGRRLITFGRVPLFFYLLHLYVIHLGSRAYNLVLEGEFRSGMHSSFEGRPGSTGHDLLTVYAAWILLSLLLYFPCAAYARFKRQHPSRLLSYL